MIYASLTCCSLVRMPGRSGVTMSLGQEEKEKDLVATELDVSKIGVDAELNGGAGGATVDVKLQGNAEAGPDTVAMADVDVEEQREDEGAAIMLGL